MNIRFEDNRSCIKLTNNPERHGRSKHIAVRYLFVQEKVERHEVAVKYCPTNETTADITKELAKDKYSKIRAKVGFSLVISAVEPPLWAHNLLKVE